MELTKNKAFVTHEMKDKLFNLPIDKESGMVVSKEDMHDLTLKLMFTNTGWKDDESEPVIIKSEPIKEVIGKSTHTVDLFLSDLSSSIPVITTRNKEKIKSG